MGISPGSKKQDTKWNKMRESHKKKKKTPQKYIGGFKDNEGENLNGK